MRYLAAVLMGRASVALDLIAACSPREPLRLSLKHARNLDSAPHHHLHCLTFCYFQGPSGEPKASRVC